MWVFSVDLNATPVERMWCLSCMIIELTIRSNNCMSHISIKTLLIKSEKPYPLRLEILQQVLFFRLNSASTNLTFRTQMPTFWPSHDLEMSKNLGWLKNGMEIFWSNGRNRNVNYHLIT